MAQYGRWVPEPGDEKDASHDPTWVPRYRLPAPTLTTVLTSEAFRTCREQARAVVADPVALRDLAYRVRHTVGRPGPLDTVVAQVLACEQFLLHEADALSAGEWVWAVEGDVDIDGSGPLPQPDPPDEDTGQRSAGARSRRRLIVATLLYLVLVDDMRPDPLPGGYVDDALLIAWVAGVASQELGPHLEA